MGARQIDAVRRVASARLPTRWGVFKALAFERDLSSGSRRLETARALVLGALDSEERAPLLRIHAQCLTGETFRSLRCDCADQLDLAMREIAHEGRGLAMVTVADLARYRLAAKHDRPVAGVAAPGKSRERHAARCESAFAGRADTVD